MPPPVSAPAACCSRTKSLMKSMFCSMTSLATPELSRPLRNAVQEGSTFDDVNPFSESYPIWATCLNDPAVGAEIIDLSILPPLPDFFFVTSDDLGLSADGSGQKESLSSNAERQYHFRICELALVCKTPWPHSHLRRRIQSCIPIAEELALIHGSRS